MSGAPFSIFELVRMDAGATLREPAEDRAFAARDDGRSSAAPRVPAATVPCEEIETWLREHPAVCEALARNEPVTVARFPRKNAAGAPALLVPVRDASGLQAVLCCDAANAGVALRLKQLESDLTGARREKGELEALGQMSLHLWSNALHELRSHLVAVRGYARMLLGEGPGPLNQTQRQFLEIVLDNAKELAGILDDLTRVSQGQALRLAPLDLRGLWAQVLELLRPRAGRKSIRVTERSAPPSVVVMADREKMLPVFCRLLSDAIEATEPGGEIQVEFRRDDEQTEMRLYGSGAGTRFVRGRDAASLRDVILRHGGAMSLRNAPDQPSVFTLTFPVIQTDQCEEPPEYEQRPSSASG